VTGISATVAGKITCANRRWGLCHLGLDNELARLVKLTSHRVRSARLQEHLEYLVGTSLIPICALWCERLWRLTQTGARRRKGLGNLIPIGVPWHEEPWGLAPIGASRGEGPRDLIKLITKTRSKR
jgi:hypothetical protein